MSHDAEVPVALAPATSKPIINQRGVNVIPEK